MGFVRYLVQLALSVCLMACPRRLLERAARDRLLRQFYPHCSHVQFYKSGRSALAAIFRHVAAENPGATVLLPDYICNVVYRAAAQDNLRRESYRIGGGFRVDVTDLEEKLRRNKVACVLVASLLGNRNHDDVLFKRIRRVAPQVLIVADECQNLVLDSPLVPDDRTVIVFSFNRKTIPGMMGGGLCDAGLALGIPEPGRIVWRDVALEVRVLLGLGKEACRRMAYALRATLRRPSAFVHPRLEHSSCRTILYDTEVQRIARMSLVRGLIGMASAERLERQRRAEYYRLRQYLERSELARLLVVERADGAGLVAVASPDPRLFGLLPLKGPYALDEDASRSLRPEAFAVINDGTLPLILPQIEARQTRSEKARADQGVWK